MSGQETTGLPDCRWLSNAYCTCNHSPDDHAPIVHRPVCLDPGRVLFEGMLGRCESGGCPCDQFERREGR